MRHLKSRLRLSQKPAHAQMMQRNLVTSLLLYESVRTTKKRAQVIQPTIDHIIHIAKTRPAHFAIRFINKVVTDKNASRKVMEVFKDRYKSRTSGLTRIVPVGVRKGDGAEVVDITLIDSELTRSSSEKNPKNPTSLRKSKSSSSSVSSPSSASSDKK